MELTPASLEIIADPLVVLDAAGTVVAANGAGGSWIGVPAPRFLRRPAVEFPALAAALESLHRNGCRLADLEAERPVCLPIGGGPLGVSTQVVEVHRVSGDGLFAFALVFRPAVPAPPAAGNQATSAPAAVNSPASTASLPAGKMRVLVTDDDAMVRTIIAAVLRQQGFAVVEAQDGEEALAWWKRLPDGFDLVLLDLHMPGLGGVEVMECLRALSPAVKVILLSGSLGEATAGIPAKGVRYLQKPFRNEELVELVRQTLAE